MTRSVSHPVEVLGAKVPLSRPGDPGYAAATDIWAARIAGDAPIAVAHCRNAADVQDALRAARKHDLPISVRGGGHDWAGRALCGGLVIDLSPMRGVSVEADGASVLIGGGALARDVCHAADRIGRAAVTGAVGVVGMGGLTLGGGYGSLIGRFGLVLDNLAAAEVVLADASVVVADEESNAELFWALRGGGGNFGVVTRMRHRLHPLRSVHAGIILFPIAQAETVLGRFADLVETAPDELTVQVGFISGPDGEPLVFLAPTWSGAPAEGEARVEPLAKLGAPLAVQLATQAPGAANGLFDRYAVNGHRVRMETRWLPGLNPESIHALAEAFAARPSAGCSIVTHEFRGAAARVPADT